jgi:hypothetical protein
MHIQALRFAIAVVGSLIVLSSASPVRGVGAIGAHRSHTVSLLRQVKVNCGTIQGKTYSCPDGYTCVGGAGGSCRKAAAVPLRMSCAVCTSNQKRDSDACLLSGTQIQQLQCVNRVNAEFLKCQDGCRP